MKKITTILVLLSFCFGKVSGQVTKPLIIGEKVPDLVLSLHTGKNLSHKHLSEFKGKLVILDYWHINCLTCIVSMPKLLQLQKQFNGQIQIILVNVLNDQAEIDKIWAKIGNTKQGKNIIQAYNQLPSVIADNTTQFKKVINVSNDTTNALYDLFPKNNYPAHIWIDGAGIYRHLINAEDGSEANEIESFLAGSKLKLLDKTNESNLDLSQPLSWSKKLPDTSTFYSILTPRIENNNINTGETLKDSNYNKVVGFSGQNMTILMLYQWAYMNEKNDRFTSWYPDDKIILDVKDTQDYTVPKFDDPSWHEWVIKHTYCYAIKVPLSLSEKLFENMKLDLDRIFRIHSKIGTRLVKCLVLKRMATENKFKATGEHTQLSNFVDNDGHQILSFKNCPMDVFVNSGLKNMFWVEGETNKAYKVPFLDETNYRGKVDIEIPSFNDNPYYIKTPLSKVLNILKVKYGLEVVEEYRNINVLVLTRNDHEPGSIN